MKEPGILDNKNCQYIFLKLTETVQNDMKPGNEDCLIRIINAFDENSKYFCVHFPIQLLYPLRNPTSKRSCIACDRLLQKFFQFLKNGRFRSSLSISIKDNMENPTDLDTAATYNCVS